MIAARNLLLGMSLAGTLVACGGDKAAAEGGQEAAAEAANTDPTVTKAAELAKKIDAEPGKAEAILEEAGMSVEDFEALMLDISSDPAKTEAFAKARAG